MLHCTKVSIFTGNGGAGQGKGGDGGEREQHDRRRATGENKTGPHQT